MVGVCFLVWPFIFLGRGVVCWGDWFVGLVLIDQLPFSPS